MGGICDESTVDFKVCRKHFSRLGWALSALLVVPLVVQLLPLIMVGALDAPLFQDLWFKMILSTVALYLVGYPLCWIIMRGLPEAETQVTPMPLGKLVRLLFIALAALYLTNYITVVLTDVIGSLRGSPVINPVEELSGYPLPYVLVVSCVLAPVAEESVFRGLLFRRLLPYGDRFAVLASSLAFAMIHGNLSQMLYAFTVGLVFGYIALHTGRIRETILLHAIANFIGGGLYPLLQWLFPDGPARDMALLVMEVAILFSIVMGVVFFLRYRRSMYLRIQDGLIGEGRKWGLLFGNAGMVVFTLVVLCYVASFLFGS